jgi:RNA polymerase sigma-70 factor (ECF subfamily)
MKLLQLSSQSRLAPPQEKSLVYTIIKNCCVDRYRRRSALSRVLGQLRDLLGSTSNQDYDLALTIQTLVAKLPDRQRTIFILRHWHGFSTAETAELLKLDEGTVKSHLKRSIDKLKAELQGHRALRSSPTLPK